MKKIVTGVLAFLMGATIAVAQQPATSTPEKQKAEHRAEKPGQKAHKPAIDSTGRPMKKDGTPDKRFRENQENKDGKQQPQGPVKKDGTPDKRFKDNKENKDNKDAKPEGPRKKDGTPDKRFKDNKEKIPAEQKS